MMGYRRLVNYGSIIQLDDYMYNFCCRGIFIRKIKFAVNLVNNKVVDNLLIYLVQKIYDYRPHGVRVIAPRSLLSDLLIL